ncbi:MAG: sigma-70 family RNA polymerase sigma factor [Deltaproteobacteria bacterium]|nr:sigma-70 family RNA polymerase sigma factor [Deltaproteobacteria bacterium]
MSLNAWLSIGRRKEAAAPALSFERLFNDHAAYVGRCLRYLGVGESDLEDCCQEVFLVVHRRLGDLDPEATVRAWVRQICVHVAQNHRRSRRRRREQPVGEPVEVARAANQESAVEQSELRTTLLEVLDKLSDDQRTVFVLFEIERMPMGEVATAVGAPLQTAYSRLHAARARVQEAVARMETGPAS